MTLIKRIQFVLGLVVILLMTTVISAQGGSQVRFVHAVPAAPAIDIYANGQLVIDALEFGQATTYVNAAAGIHNITVTATGTITPLWEQQITLGESSALTMIASSAADLQFIPFEDDLAALAEGNARFLLIHAIADGPAVDVVTMDNAPIAQNLDYNRSVGTFDVPAAVYDVAVLPAGGTMADAIVPALSLEFIEGTSNIAVVYGTPTEPQAMLLSAATEGSEADVALAENIVAAADLAESTAAPAPDLAESEIVISTPAPAQPTAAPVVVASADEGPTTARVILDPGANIQLRQYPDSEALSLGLAPSGTVFEVIGREGRPVALVEGLPPPPEAATYVDPAEGLPEDEDLDPEQVWLRVSYNTPDGGTILSWVNALYLDVRDFEGGRQRLADLDTVPRNLPGESVATEITPPSEAVDRVVAVVYNLDPGINLNIRRSPERDGEVLARIPNGTVLEFIGTNRGGDWVFVEYLPAEGGSVTGWAGALYIRYELNGERTDLEELEEEELLPAPVSENERGRVRGDVEAVIRPTADPLEDVVVADVALDAGANLHLRRDPDSASESLVLIPSGSRLQVSDITANNDWLQVTYEGTVGWIAADFVVLSYNGEFIEANNVSFTTTGEAVVSEGAAPVAVPQATAAPSNLNVEREEDPEEPVVFPTNTQVPGGPVATPGLGN